MPSGGCRRGVQPAVAARPHLGLFCLVGNARLRPKCMDEFPDAQQVPLSSPITEVVVPAAAGSSSLDGGGAEPPSKRAHPLSFLSASTRYVCGAEFPGMPFPLPAFQILGFEGSVGLNDRSRTLLVSGICRQLAVSVALAMEVLGAGGAPRGIIGTEMSGASVPRSAAPGEAVSAPKSLGTMRLELPEPYLPSSSDSTSPRHQLEVGGERSRAGMLAGHHRRAVAPPDTGLGPPQHSSARPGQSGKEKQKNPSHIPNDFLCAYLLFCVLFL
jgi:hypothetical protein